MYGGSDTNGNVSIDLDDFEVVAGEEVSRIGLAFKSLPPEAMEVKRVFAWAAQNGIKEGDLVIAVNGRSVEEIQPAECRELMLTRPISFRIHRPMEDDPVLRAGHATPRATCIDTDKIEMATNGDTGMPGGERAPMAPDSDDIFNYFLNQLCCTGKRAPAHSRPSSQADDAVGDPVIVGGRRGVVSWDGRPEHQFVKVMWDDDDTESGVIPVAELNEARAPAPVAVTKPRAPARATMSEFSADLAKAVRSSQVMDRGKVKCSKCEGKGSRTTWVQERSFFCKDCDVCGGQGEVDADEYS